MDDRPTSPAPRKRRRRTRVAQTVHDIPAVTLISIGLGTASGKALVHELETSDTVYEIFDLRGRLVKDPQTVVLHKETGADARVQRIVIAQQGRDDIVTEAFFSVTLEHVMVVVMACHSGHHRADTASNRLKDLINSVHDRHGRRLFKVVSSWAHGKYCRGASDDDERLQLEPRCVGVGCGSVCWQAALVWLHGCELRRSGVATVASSFARTRLEVPLLRRPNGGSRVDRGVRQGGVRQGHA